MSKLISREPQITYKETWLCGEKGCAGEMEWGGICLTVLPPIYPHKCSICGRQEPTTYGNYPMIVTERDDRYKTVEITNDD